MCGCLLGGLLLAGPARWQPVQAQTKHTSTMKVKKQTKKGIRQARRTKAQYKDTHLNPDVFAFKKGEHGRKYLTPRDGYDFDTSGMPIIENKPRRKGLFGRSKP